LDIRFIALASAHSETLGLKSSALFEKLFIGLDLIANGNPIGGAGQSNHPHKLLVLLVAEALGSSRASRGGLRRRPMPPD
jgi:hypothetical protein